METDELIQDDSKFTSLFIQLQPMIRNRSPIRSHTGVPGSLAKCNNEIDQLLTGSVLEASKFHKNTMLTAKVYRKNSLIIWKQAKEIVRQCPTWSLYNQIPLPKGSNPKCTQRNEIWQMDVFHFTKFGKQRYVHHTIDIFSISMDNCLSFRIKVESVITHYLDLMVIMEYANKMDNGLTCL